MNYNDVKTNETLRIYRDWLPYSIGTPSEAVSYDDGYERANLVFMSDSHIDHRNTEASLQNVEDTVEFINESPVPFDVVIHCGDIITPFWKVDKNNAVKRAESFFEIAKNCQAPFLFSKGNHDLNDWGNYPENMLTDEDWGRLFLDNGEERYGIVRQKKGNGQKSTWHYYDIEKHKIRVVVLDIQDTDKSVLTEEGTVKLHGGESFYFSNEQMNWIASVALDFDDKEDFGWGVIFAFHQSSTSEKYHEAVIPKLACLCEAFQNQKSYSYKYTHPENPFFNLDIDADFTRYKMSDKKPHIICWLLGHMHEDKCEVINGINVIYTLNQSATSVSGDARLVRIPGTVTQNAFDIVNIDTRHRRIRLFRYGAGVNCYGTGGNRFLPEGLPY